MNTVMVTLLGIHIFACVLCAVLIRLRILKCREIEVFLLAFLPVYGFTALLIQHICSKNAGQEDAFREASEDGDAAFFPEADALEERVVPLQEALLLNDATTRRELMLDVLYAGAGDYVPQLSAARENSDTEVVHYAVTALVEIQKEFDLKMQALDRKRRAAPGDEALLREQQRLLEDCLLGGLPEGSRKEALLRTYLEVLEQRISAQENSIPLWMKKAEADMRLGNGEALRKDAEKLISLRPEKETGYLYLLKYHALCKNAEGIRSVLKMIAERQVYLSPKGRAEAAFWQEG